MKPCFLFEDHADNCSINSHNYPQLIPDVHIRSYRCARRDSRRAFHWVLRRHPHRPSLHGHCVHQDKYRKSARFGKEKAFTNKYEMISCVVFFQTKGMKENLLDAGEILWKRWNTVYYCQIILLCFKICKKYEDPAPLNYAPMKNYISFWRSDKLNFQSEELLEKFLKYVKWTGRLVGMGPYGRMIDATRKEKKHRKEVAEQRKFVETSERAVRVYKGRVIFMKFK